ncbi:hypothetical protein ABZ250_14160 [Streptomyces afghaniensis]|uniref:hypothetical protein n=1 Tax=Streptomyces afghaniensis TaxID=66865 RepID=UPI0033B71258
MEYTRRKNGYAKGLAWMTGALAALTAGAWLMASVRSFAANLPTTKELLDACSWADLYDFHPQTYPSYIHRAQQVGAPAFNCAREADEAKGTRREATAVGNPVDIEISERASNRKGFETPVEAGCSHTWETSAVGDTCSTSGNATTYGLDTRMALSGHDSHGR